MLLDDMCNSSVYASNPFHVLGLTVDMTSRKIRRRQEDVVDGCARMGDQAWQNEFDKCLLGDCAVPTIETATSLFERLKDPEYFATAMFFWFWPQAEQNDPAVESIIKGERDVAVRIWQADMNKSGERGIVARHNLAVALHFYAVDGENDILSHMGDMDTEYFKAVDRFWKSSFDLWECLVDDDLFWEVFSERVDRLNDPRLDEAFIDSFRERFPICFDNVNADFLVAYARAGKLNEAKRHFDYMLSTMSGIDDVEETVERAFKPMVDKVRTLIRQCESVKNPREVLDACRRLLDDSKSLVSTFKTLVPDGNSFTRSVLNEIVVMVDGRLPDYSRATGDYEPCLKLTRELLPIAATPLQKEKIQKSIEEWEDILRKEREKATCCVCGRYQRGIPTRTVKMHKDVHESPIMRGRIEWRTRTISNVPVCSSCTSRFTYEHARQFSPVRDSLAEGWKFGEKPSAAERANASSI